MKALKHALLYNIFCCWMVTAIGGVTARHIMVYRDRTDTDRSFALFWLFASALWFSSGLRLLFHGLGWYPMDRITFYVVQIFVMIHVLPGALHTVLKITAKRLFLVVVMSCIVFSSALFGFFILYDGVTTLSYSDWGSEYAISNRAFLCVIPSFLVLVIGNIFDIVRKLVCWRILKTEPLEHTMASVAIIIYVLAGTVDLKGYDAGWSLLIERAVYLVAALISYTGYIWDSDSAMIEDTVERSNF